MQETLEVLYSAGSIELVIFGGKGEQIESSVSEDMYGEDVQGLENVKSGTVRLAVSESRLIGCRPSINNFSVPIIFDSRNPRWNFSSFFAKVNFLQLSILRESGCGVRLYIKKRLSPAHTFLWVFPDTITRCR